LSDLLQRRQLIVGNVSAIIFLKAVNEEPPVTLVGCNKCSCATTLAATRKPNTFLYNTTAEIGIDQTLAHFYNRIT